MSDEPDGVQEVAPWEPDEGRFSVTLKGHKDYSATWTVISDKTANGLRRRILAYFGWSEEDNAELSLADLVFNATQTYHAMHAIGETFSGARSVGYQRGGGSARDRAFQAAKEESEQAPDPKDVLLAQIEAQESVPALKRLYGENKAAFEEKDGENLTPAATELVAAYKAKGKALSAAANQ